MTLSLLLFQSFDDAFECRVISNRIKLSISLELTGVRKSLLHSLTGAWS